MRLNPSVTSSTQSQRRREQTLLIVFDYLSLVTSFFIVHSIRFGEPVTSFWFTPTFTGMTFIMFFYQYVMNLFEPWGWRSKLFSPFRSAYSVIAIAVTVILVVYFLSLDSRGLIGRGILIAGLASFYFLSLIGRFFLKQIYKNRSRSRWLVLLKNQSQQMLNPDLSKTNQYLFTQIETLEPTSDGHLILPEKNKQLLENQWDGVVVESNLAPDLLRKFMRLRLSGIEVFTVDRFFELFFNKVPIHFIDRSWFAFGVGFQLYQRRIHKRIKRALDIIVSLTVLFLCLPLILLAFLAVRMESPGGSFFTQQRVGENGKVFTIWKFRTMRQDAEKDGAQWAQKNDSRVTRLGGLLRLTRIDELPQLINVLVGDMSFIGPRPERPEFVSVLREEIPFYDIRHTVKPGLTGWAQIHYPYGASVEDAIQKLQYEIYYIKNYSILMDLKIMAKTIQIVLFAKGR